MIPWNILWNVWFRVKHFLNSVIPCEKLSDVWFHVKNSLTCVIPCRKRFSLWKRFFEKCDWVTAVTWKVPFVKKRFPETYKPWESTCSKHVKRWVVNKVVLMSYCLFRKRVISRETASWVSEWNYSANSTATVFKSNSVWIRACDSFTTFHMLHPKVMHRSVQFWIAIENFDFLVINKTD